MSESRARTKNVELLQRDAKLIDDTPAMGNLVKIKKASFVTLTGSPANQTGFKVVRKDDHPGEKPVNKPVIRRTRRTDASPVLCLTFPEGTTEAQVTEALQSYGMSNYTVKQADGLYQAIRSDLQSIAKEGTMDIKLNDAGMIATVTRTDAAPEPKSGIAIAAYEFDATKFDEKAIDAWLQRNSIDSKIAETENSDQAYVVRRSAVPENEETRRMVIEEGITAVIVRADANDIPEGYVSAVCEAAYGNWGWGHLDFAATIADVAFSDQMRKGVSSLEEVLRNILFYSNLPIDVRKTLVASSLEQFGAFANMLMDSLPRQLLVSVVRSAQPNLENLMTKANESGATTTTPVVAATATPPAADAPLTRADLDASVSAAVVAALEAAGIKRSDAPAATPAVVVNTTATPPAGTEAALTRADMVAIIGDAFKPVIERLEKVEGTTVVRSDAAAAGAASVTPVVPTAEAVEASKKDGTIFRGAFGNLTGRKA